VVTAGINQEITQYLTSGQFQDYLGFVNIAGRSTVNHMKLAYAGVKPRIWCGGDSITYGYLVDEDQRWASLLDAEIGGEVVVSGRGGGTSYGLNERVQDEALPMQPHVAILAIGTNDSGGTVSQADFQTYTQAMNTALQSAGIKTVWAILPAVGLSPSTRIQQENVWLLGLPADGFVRFDLALAVGNAAGGNNNASLFNSDLVHPNSAGHRAMANRFPVDVPWLFD
jgi:lysophospholipase L1-like esterase